jgi:hypothetical protein
MSEVSGYTMHLYCDHEKHEPFSYVKDVWGEYVGETNGQCKRQAQKNGWIFKRDRTVICPVCSGAKTEEQAKAIFHGGQQEVTNLMAQQGERG